VSVFDDLPIPDGDDPILNEDAPSLRAEILRLRESLLAANGRTEVLTDRIAELEEIEARLHAANTALREQLDRHPLIRVLQAVRRRRPGAS
jgi:uncharacterized protein YhaN